MNTPPVEPRKVDPVDPEDHTRTVGADSLIRAELNFFEPPVRPDSLGRLGHYEILEVLGRGGFGVVFRAFDNHLQRVVAIKVLAAEMAAASPARRRFLREARSAAQVRHENVVQIHAIEEQPLPYLVMEYVPGETLQQRLDRIGPLDAAEVAAIGRHMADALAAAHAAGLIHRDIKPGNVLLEASPQLKVKVTDFGLARAADDASISQSGTVAGTPLYMSPEQARGDKLDHRTDLFSLGSVLYALTTGRPPFRAGNALAVLKRVTEEHPRPIPEIIPETPASLCRVIARLMEKDPARRFQTAAEAAEALEAGLKGRPPTEDWTAPSTQRLRRPVAILAGVLTLAAILTAVLYLLTRPAADPAGTPAGQGRVGVGAPPRGGDRPKPEELKAVDGKMPAPVEPSKNPPASANPDRRAAEWVLSVGGAVQVKDGPEKDLRSATELPKGSFMLSKVLIAGNLEVSDAGVAHLEGLTGVKHLGLSGTKVTAAGLEHLRDMKGLMHLYLSFTPVTDDGLNHLKGLNRLTHLSLHGTLVTDTGLNQLKQFRSLQTLDVGRTTVTDAGLRHLKDLPELTSLRVRKTRVTPKGLNDFHEAVPACWIEHDGGVIEPTK